MAGSSALEKTLRIIEELSAPGGPHRLAEVAAASGVPKSSTYRILASLVEQGYAVTDGEGSYGIGLRLRSVAAGICAERPEGITELLEFLHKGTGHAVHLALRHGAALTYIRKVESGRPSRSPPASARGPPCTPPPSAAPSWPTSRRRRRGRCAGPPERRRTPPVS